MVLLTKKIAIVGSTVAHRYNQQNVELTTNRLSASNFIRTA